MKQPDVERWVVEVLSRIERGERIEDDRVELKRELPGDHRKAARRIAGHANQAREDRILWVIGAHDAESDQRIPGVPADTPDAADWWPQVEAVFDELAPSPVWVNVGHEGVTVLGVGFVADRTPYLVKIPGDALNREVPWREGTRVRSANRPDLLRLLVPAAHRPVMTVLGGRLWVREDAKEARRWQWGGTMNVYVETIEPVVIPDHLCAASVDLGAGPFEVSAHCSTPARTFRPGRGETVPEGAVVSRGDDQLLVATHSKIRVVFNQKAEFLESNFAPGARGRVSVQLVTAGLERTTVHLEAGLRPGDASANLTALWEIHP